MIVWWPFLPFWLVLFRRVERGKDGIAGTRRKEEIRRSLWRLRRAYSVAGGGRALAELGELLGQLKPKAGGLEKALIAWIDAVELLVQQAERLRPGPGRGERKKRQVKAALVHLMVRLARDGGRVPNPFEPLLYGVVADVSIDTVVLLINRNSLWETDGSASGAPRQRWRPFAALSAWLGGITTRLVLAFYPVPRALKARLDEAAAATSLGGVLSATVQLAQWVGHHRDAAVAVVEIVSVTVQQAEGYLQMSGREKKAYARDLILVFLEDEGLLPAAGTWGNALASTVIDAAVEAVVFLFNRRGLFRHGQRTQETTGTQRTMKRVPDVPAVPFVLF